MQIPLQLNVRFSWIDVAPRCISWRHTAYWCVCSLHYVEMAKLINEDTVSGKYLVVKKV